MSVNVEYQLFIDLLMDGGGGLKLIKRYSTRVVQ